MKKLVAVALLLLVISAVGCSREKKQTGSTPTNSTATNPTATNPTRPADEPQIKNLGMIGLKSVQGNYLQAHDDGQMHASNGNRNEEETWFLISIDPAKNIYALENWKTGKFLNKKVGTDQLWANSTIVTNNEEWEMVSGKPAGVLNAIAFKSVADGTYMGANNSGDDTGGGGEVSAPSTDVPKADGYTKRDWWVMEAATAPSPGKDVWNTVGGAISQVGQKIVNNISAADVVAIIAALS